MYWFNTEDKHEAIWAVYDHMLQEQAERLQRWREYTSIYTEDECSGFSPLSKHISLTEDREPSYNVSAICVDTLTSRITAQNPSIKIITSEGPETLQLTAKNLEQLSQGVLHMSGGMRESQAAMRDAAIYGVGYVRSFVLNGEIKLKRIHPGLIFVDRFSESKPDIMYQVSYIPRDALLNQFPDKEEAINSATAFEGRDENIELPPSGVPDIIEVLECWKCGTKENPGIYVCCIEKATLIENEYTLSFPPIAIMRYDDPITGFYSRGLISRLTPIQRQIDYISKRIGINMDLWSQPYMAVSRETQLDQEDCWTTNEFGRFLKYAGNPPVLVKPEGISEQVIRYLENLYQKAFEISRLSQLSAAGQKPAGLDSGVAIRTYNDIETRGFATLSKAYHNFIADICRNIISCASQIAKSGKRKYNVIWNNDNNDVIKEISVKDYDNFLSSSQSLIIRAYHSSDLPNTPGAKLQYIRELLQDGLMDPREAREHLGMPDVDKSEKLYSASVNYTKAILEKIIEEKKYIRPNNVQDVDYSIQMAKAYYLQIAQSDNADKEVLDLLDTYIYDLKSLLPPPPQPPQQMPQNIDPSMMEEIPPQ